jgi:hypothetical protein
MDCKIYPMTRDEDVTLEDFIDKMVANGYIRPSKYPPMHHHSSLSRKRTENYDRYKIIAG